MGQHTAGNCRKKGKKSTREQASWFQEKKKGIHLSPNHLRRRSHQNSGSVGALYRKTNFKIFKFVTVNPYRCQIILFYWFLIHKLQRTQSIDWPCVLLSVCPPSPTAVAQLPMLPCHPFFEFGAQQPDRQPQLFRSLCSALIPSHGSLGASITSRLWSCSDHAQASSHAFSTFLFNHFGHSHSQKTP